VNNDAIEARGAVDVALTPLTHHGSFGARSPAGAAAADRVLFAARAVIIAGADHVGVQLGELATTVDTTSASAAGANTVQSLSSTHVVA
jgi:hypothetical protein